MDKPIHRKLLFGIIHVIYKSLRLEVKANANISGEEPVINNYIPILFETPTSCFVEMVVLGDYEWG